MCRRLVLIIFSVMWMTAMAIESSFTRRISSADGLSNDFVISLAIDGQGYVWVATEAGINRIAGKSCQSFPKSEFIDGQRITSLYWHESSDKMFIGLDKGLSVYSPLTGETFDLADKDGLIAASLNDIVPAINNHVWLIYGNGQVQRLNCDDLHVENFNLDKPYNNRCALDDGQGHLYLGHSQHGMTIVNLNDGKIKHYEHQPNNENSLPGNNVRTIFQDNMRRLWVGTNNGMALFNPSKGTFSKVRFTDNDYDYNVYDILQFQDGSIWMATDIGGIHTILPPEDSSSGQWMIDDETEINTSSLNTRSLVQDEFGNVWVGNHSTGVDFFSAQKSDFNLLEYMDDENRYRPVYAITPDSDNKGFWIAGEELSLWQGNKLVGSWSGLKDTNQKYSSVRCLMSDHSGYIWIGVDDHGVFRFDKAKGQLEPNPIYADGFDILSFGEDIDGKVWIGSEFAVYIYDQGKTRREETISSILKAPATYFEHISNDQIFITTLGDGVYLFNLKTKSYKHLSSENNFPPTKINQVIHDRGHGLWLGTNAGLVYMADPANLSGISIYGEEQGLANKHILALQQDSYGNIWMSTYKGISCFVKSSEKFYNYDLLDTQQPGGFSIGASMTDVDGTIYFGSASGVCYFNPQQMKTSRIVSDVQIITFEAYNPVGRNTEIRLLTPDKEGKVYTTYQQNTLRLTFTVRNFAQARYVEYSYMMKGMDDKWYDIGNDHDVVFRGLRPGHYTFILRAKLKGQDWDNDHSTQIDITIAPPFWKTWWAYLLYILAFISWIVWLFRSYKHRLTLRNSLEMEKRENLQKQELNEERLRFFTNVTHELRTPLTLILGPLEDLITDKQLSETNRRRVTVIQKSAQRLHNLINDILDFRKTETRNRRLSVAKGDLGQFVREICLNFKELYRNPKVQFLYHIDDNLTEVYFDSEVITTILNNFLSNAIKYTDEGSIKVNVYTNENETLDILVTDTGYGISPQALPHIFERYYQAKGSHQASGTGIGLALVKSLADLHEAHLNVESKEGKGSRFTLSLSIKNTYPNALHKEDTPSDKQEMKTMEIKDDDTHPLFLIVEDNADIRQYIADSFGEDFQILQAENGQEGLQMAETHMPDIIVSDIMMPKMNGIQLTRQLKEDIRTSHIPVILLTAKDTDEDKEEGYDSGADSYLTKPFTAKLLASRIQNLLTSRRRMAEFLMEHHDNLDVTASPDTPQLSRIDQKFLDKLNQIIDDNIMTEDIDLTFMTDKMAMSHSTFYRKVKALTGMTAKEYIRKYRLRHCYKLLQSGEYNVNEAAMMTGFNQMAHFREIFKQEFGILPSEVKKRK